MRFILLLSSLFLISSCGGGSWGHQNGYGYGQSHGYHSGHRVQVSHCPACHASIRPQVSAEHYTQKAQLDTDCDICRNSPQGSYGHGYGYGYPYGYGYGYRW